MSVSKIFKRLLWGCCFILVAYGVYRFTETPKDTRRVKTEASLDSNELMAILSSDVDSRLVQYIEKAIEVESVITAITVKDGVYTLMLKGDNKGTFVLCEMQRNQNSTITALKEGDVVIVKGVFKGFLKDAVLLNCIIV